jgi:hypothetical protein
LLTPFITFIPGEVVREEEEERYRREGRHIFH